MSHVATKDEQRRMVEALTGVKIGDQLDELPTEDELLSFAGFVQPTLRDAICTLCGKTGREHVGIDGCPVAETKGFEFL